MKIELLNGKHAIVREVVKDDAEKLIEYLQSISSESEYLTFGEGELSLSKETEESIICEHITVNNKLMIVAEYEDQIIGNLNFCGGSRLRIEHTGEFGVSVKKEFWNNGIAEKFIDYLVGWAKNHGIITKINLRVREDNDKAIRLYARKGFMEEGRVTRDFYVAGKFYSSILMGLEL